MPTALMLAASAASGMSPGWILRGLQGFCLRLRGSTRRSSICSLLTQFSKLFLENIDPESAERSAGAKAARAPGFGPPSVSGGPNPPFAADERPCFGPLSSFSSQTCLCSSEQAKGQPRRNVRANETTKVERIVLELETRGDSRTMFRLLTRQRYRRGEPDGGSGACPRRRDS